MQININLAIYTINSMKINPRGITPSGVNNIFRFASVLHTYMFLFITAIHQAEFQED